MRRRQLHGVDRGSVKASSKGLPRSHEVKLNDLAVKIGRGTDDLVQEAVARLLAHRDWLKAQVQFAIDQIAHGELVEEGEMDARVTRLLRIRRAEVASTDLQSE